MLLSISRAILVYFFVLLATRIMGKREIGNLTAFDLIIAIMIAELGVIPLQDSALPLREGIVPMLVLTALEILLAFLTLKSVKLRRILVGEPTVIIEDGKILDDKLRKLRYNINDLLSQLREKDVFDISDVEYALLEPSGHMSILLKSQKRPVTPSDLSLDTPYDGVSYDLICDGEIQYINLKLVGLDMAKFMDLLKKNGIEDYTDIMLASLNTKGELYYSAKGQASRTDEK